MSLSDVGVPGQRVDVLHGGDVAPDGRLLSVAEIQEAFRELRQRRANHDVAIVPAGHMASRRGTPAVDLDRAPTATAHTGHRTAHTDIRTWFAGVDTPRPARPVTAPSECPEAPDGPRTTVEASYTARGTCRFDRAWVAVVAAHSGAGASCVALAIAHALAQANRSSRLIESVPSSRSGLVAAASVELGTDSTGGWLRGIRTEISLYRRASDSAPVDWPEQAGTDVATVVDLGSLAPEHLAGLAASRPTVVVVCRATLPGVRAVESLLSQLGGTTRVVAVVGPRRWKREVVASAGPLFRRLREAGRVVPVPDDRRLQVTGITAAPLPKSALVAGRELLARIDAAQGLPGTTGPRGPRAPARHAYRQKAASDEHRRSVAGQPSDRGRRLPGRVDRHAGGG
jgi:hypothetical protein